MLGYKNDAMLKIPEKLNVRFIPFESGTGKGHLKKTIKCENQPVLLLHLVFRSEGVWARNCASQP